MTRLVRFSNNGVSRLAANITNASTSISLTPGDGAKFPTLSGTQFFMATLIKSDGTTEIVKVTARSTDTLTVVRAAEPVGATQTAYAFTAGDRIEQRLTAKALSDELDRLDSGANIGAANKTANYTVVAADVSTLIRVDTTAGAITVTLPQISTLADDFDIMVAKVTGDANLVSVVRAGTDLINGVASYSLNNQWQSVWLIADRSTNTWTAINSGAGSTSVTVDTFTGTGTAGPFTLSGDPVAKSNTAVYVGGVYQQKSTYTLAGISLTLGGAVAAGVTVEVVWSQPVAIGRTDAALVTYDGQTVQDVLDAVTGPTGAASVGYTPSGVGAVATTVQSKLRSSDVRLSEFVPEGADLSLSPSNAIIEKAIAATPIGGSLILDYNGTVLVDTKTDVFVVIAGSIPENKAYAAIKVSKPIEIVGTKNCLIKVKEFSTAWASMISGDSVCVFLVTESNAPIKRVRIHANSNTHYETDLSGFKWWDAYSGRRPIDAVRVIPESSTSPRISGSHVIECEITDPLAGVTFSGNLLASDKADFIAGKKQTGIVQGCFSIRNKISGARGNAVNFISGAQDCWSWFDSTWNGMYHAYRFYSDVIDCYVFGANDRVFAEEVVARWNETDLGYWRTNNPASGSYRMTRAGFCLGGEWNYVSNIHNILRPRVINAKGLFVKLAANHTTYYDNSSGFYLSGVNSVQMPPGSEIIDCEMDGYDYNIALYSTALDADRLNASVKNFTSRNSQLASVKFQNIPRLQAVGIKIIDGPVGVKQFRLRNCPYSLVDDVSFMTEKGAAGDRFGFSFEQDVTGVKLGIAMFDSSFPLANRYIKEPSMAPELATPGGAIVLSAFSNGWKATSYLIGTSGMTNWLVAHEEGIVTLSLRLDGSTNTANQVLTLPVGLRPKFLAGFSLVDAVTSKVLFGRVLTTGVVEVISAPTTGTTALIGDVTFSV